MSELKLKYDVRSAQKGGQIVARAGDIVDLIEMIGDHAIAQTKDGQLSFPLESDEYVIVTNDGAGITRNEDALYMSRGKGAK